MTRQELLRDLFTRVLDEIKVVERCKEDAHNKNDHEDWKHYQEKSEKLTEELESIVNELIYL